MRRLLFLSCLVISSILHLHSQSTNIDCQNAFVISDPESFCSDDEAFDNTNVGQSAYAAPDCWDEAENDLWFQFTATHEAVDIIIDGEDGGNLNDPQVIIYSGTCGGEIFDLNVCDSNSSGDEIAHIFTSAIEIGETYFIRVDGRNGKDGTFKICINSFNLPVLPGQDCNTASLLCDKSSFVVQSVAGGGADDDEAAASCLGDSGLGNSEDGSTWFKWTCGTAGTLTFDIIPLLSSDDLDFALFRLPNGIDDCTKEVLRCNASFTGTTDDCGINTGLDLTSTDIEEDLNCDAGEDGYVRFIDMVEGESYILVVNNFTESGNGFRIQFGGTGEFLGPELDLDIAPNEELLCNFGYDLTALPSFPGTEFEWDLGEGATPNTASGENVTVQYDGPGEKTITLSYLSDQGCRIVEEFPLDISNCSYQDSMDVNIVDIQGATCGESNGSVSVEGVMGCPEYFYGFDGGALSTGSSFSLLASGEYELVLSDRNDCTKTITIEIPEISDFDIEAGDDVTLSFGENYDANVTSSVVSGITVMWEPSSSVLCSGGGTDCLDPVLSPSETTTYTVTVTDENGCVSTDQFTVFIDLCGASTLDLMVDSVSTQICNDAMDGFISISGVDGIPSYQYKIDGGDFSVVPSFTNLGEGEYLLTVMDNNGCQRDTLITIGSFPSIMVDAGDDITFDFPGDTLQFSGSSDGANPMYSWEPNNGVFCGDGTDNCPDPMFIANTNTTYILTVIDENGCSSTDEVSIRLVERTDIFIPNVFSPNQDGMNDFFTIFGDERVIESVEELVVFDRWGNKVHESKNLILNDPSGGWNGNFGDSKAAEGVYTWVARVRFVSRPTGSPDVLKGSVTLLR